MTEPRAEVVKRLVLASEAAQRELDDVLTVYEPTPAELAAAGAALRAKSVDALEQAGTVRRPASLLALNLHELRRLAWQGVALVRLLDQVDPRWTPQPEATLADVLKPMPPEMVGALARRLHAVDLHDLCDHLPTPSAW